MSKIDDEIKKGNLVSLDVSKISGGNNAAKLIEVTFQRARADKIKPCQFCKVLTPKTIASKLSKDNMWDINWICDFCLGAIKKMDWNYEGV